MENTQENITPYSPCAGAHWSKVTMADDSMLPRIQPGDEVYILRDFPVYDGDIVAAAIDREGIVVRRIRFDDTTIELCADNPTGQSLRLVGDDRDRVRVIGRVRHIFRDADAEG